MGGKVQGRRLLISLRPEDERAIREAAALERLPLATYITRTALISARAGSESYDASAVQAALTAHGAALISASEGAAAVIMFIDIEHGHDPAVCPVMKAAKALGWKGGKVEFHPLDDARAALAELFTPEPPAEIDHDQVRLYVFGGGGLQTILGVPARG